MKEEVFSCSRCAAQFDDKESRGWHYRQKHRGCITVRYSDGASATLYRDEETNAFRCPRCSLESASDSRVRLHCAGCEAPAEAKTQNTVDDAALAELGLLYVATYQALICTACQCAVAPRWLSQHWRSTPEHSGSTCPDLKEVRLALRGHEALLVNELPTPDKAGPAIPSLPSIMANRCHLCNWCGIQPVRHWVAKHARRIGDTKEYTPPLPLELSRMVKLQRWSSVSDWFVVERGARFSEAVAQASPSANHQTVPASQVGAASSSSASTSRAPVARPAAPPIVKRKPARPKPKAAPPAQQAETREASASPSPSTPAVRPRPRPRAAAARMAASSVKRSAAASKKRTALWSSEEDEDELASASSRAASDADSDWEKRDAGVSDEDDWDEREITPDWMLESDAESEWIYGDDEGDPPKLGVAKASAALAQAEALLDENASGAEASKAEHELHSRSSTSRLSIGGRRVKQRASSSSSAVEQDWQAGPARSPSISPPPASPPRQHSAAESSHSVPLLRQSAPLDDVPDSHWSVKAEEQEEALRAASVPRAEGDGASRSVQHQEVDESSPMDASIRAQQSSVAVKVEQGVFIEPKSATEPWRATLSQLAQAVKCELTTEPIAPLAQPQSVQVATFLNSLLALAAVVLAPPYQQQGVHPSRRSALEAIVNSAAGVAQTQRQLASLTSASSAADQVRSSVSQPGSGPAFASPAPSSMASGARSSQPAASLQALPPHVYASAHSVSASSAYSATRRSREPEVHAAEPSSKRCKVEELHTQVE